MIRHLAVIARPAGLVAVLLALTTFAPTISFAGSSLPPGSDTNLSNTAPVTGRGNIGLGPSYHKHRRVWWPLPPSNLTVDGSSSYNSLTYSLVAELEDYPIAARLLLMNGGSGTPQVLAGGFCLSSQWGAPGYSNGIGAGTVPYDSSGTAFANCPLFTFSNNGEDAAPDQVYPQIAQPPQNAIVHTASGQSAGVITLDSVSGLSVGQPAYILNPLDMLRGGTVISVINGSTITLNPLPNIAATNGTKIYFPPLGMTMPPTATPPLPKLTRTDWLPVRSGTNATTSVYPRVTMPRIDGPFTGCTYVGTCYLRDSMGLLSAGAAATPNPDNVSLTLSTNLTQALPAGDMLRACQDLTLNGALVPVSSLAFAATTGVVAGMDAWVGATQYPINNPPIQQYRTVLSVGSTSTTFATPLDAHLFAANTWASGTHVQFHASVLANGSAAGGATTLTVQDDPASGATVAALAATGATYKVISNNISTQTNAATPSQTVTGTLSGTTLSLNHAIFTAGVAADQPIQLVIDLATNAAATPLSQATFQTYTAGANVLPGFTLEDNGFPSDSYTFKGSTGSNPTYVGFTKSPTTTVADGSHIKACSVPFATTAVALSGQTQISAKTLYQKPLVSIRINFSGNGVTYNSRSGFDGGFQMGTIPGAARFTGRTCPYDGVIANFNALTDNSCTQNEQFPILAIEYIGLHSGSTIALLGDSQFGSNTLSAGMAGFGYRAAAALSTLEHPVTIANSYWGGETSPVHANWAAAVINSLKPDIVVMHDISGNDNGTGYQAGGVLGFASMIEANGGLPVLATMYYHSVWGVLAETATGVQDAIDSLAISTNLGSNGIPVLDLQTLFIDPSHSQYGLATYMMPNGLHANDTGHALAATRLQTLISKFVGGQ